MSKLYQLRSTSKIPSLYAGCHWITLCIVPLLPYSICNPDLIRDTSVLIHSRSPRTS